MNQPTAITVALLDENSLTVHFKFDEAQPDQSLGDCLNQET